MKAGIFHCTKQMSKTENENFSGFALVCAHTIAFILAKMQKQICILHTFTHIYTNGSGDKEQWYVHQ